LVIAIGPQGRQASDLAAGCSARAWRMAAGCIAGATASLCAFCSIGAGRSAGLAARDP